MPYDSLISPATLLPHLGDDDWRIIDCRFSLAAPQAGYQEYLTNHIPGALYAHLDNDLSSPGYEALLAIAEAAAQANPVFLGAVLTAQSNLARTRGDLPRTIELSRQAMSRLPETDIISRSILAVNLGMAYWHTGQNDVAEKALQEAQQTAQASGNAYALLAATIFLGRVHAVRGELRQAAAIYRTAIQKGGRAPILAIAHLDLAALHFEWNELEACHAELHDAIELNRFDAPIVIADGLRGNNGVKLRIDKPIFETVSIAHAITMADVLISVAHFTGHELCGFGCALKNLGMGCASRREAESTFEHLSPRKS